jgi:hypothetical protein
VAKLIVAIEVLGNIVDWSTENGTVEVDEAYLTRSDEDDSFFTFELIDVIECEVDERQSIPIKGYTGEELAARWAKRARS